MRMQVALSCAIAAMLALVAADDLSVHDDVAARRLHGGDSNQDESSSDDYDPDGDSAADATQDEPKPPPTSSSTPVPVVDGVQMFGQCGGVFYTGSTICADPDAHCQQLSIYSSICAPLPL